MESPQSKMIAEDMDMRMARQTASQILGILDRFIPSACREEAYYHIAETCHKQGVELTTKLMRRQYEEWQKLVLECGQFSLSSKPE